MDAIVAALAAQQEELTRLLHDLGADGWRQPSPCEGWDVADVVLHLAQTNEMSIASLEDRLTGWFEEIMAGLEPAGDVDEGAAAMVAKERGGPTDELLARWTDGARRLHDLLAADDPHRRVEWVAGRLSVMTLSTTRLAETWIHTGDVARALGRSAATSDRLEHIARLAWRTLPYAFARAGREMNGPVAFELTGPDGAEWTFRPDEPTSTIVRGDALDLCLVAARRVDPADTALSAEGPDGTAVLEVVRTYA